MNTKNKIFEYITKIFIGILSLYLSFSSFILVKIITNDIILNSYKAYSIVKMEGSIIADKAESIYDTGRLLYNKFRNRKKAKEIEKEIEQEKLETKQKELELKNELEFNQKVLAGLPYIISIIIFIFTYVKILKQVEEISKKFSNKVE